MNGGIKICTRCGRELPLSAFYKYSLSRDGHTCDCAECRKALYYANRDARRKTMKENYEQNREVRKAQVTAYRDENREKYREYFREYNKTPERREYNNEWRRKRYRESVAFKLNDKMAGYISQSLKGNKKGRSWELLVGYTCEDLKRHLESLFTDGMTWDAYLRGEIHIDHIIPKSIFNITSEKSKGFKKCWALENLRPLWAKDNLIKNNKLFAA